MRACGIATPPPVPVDPNSSRLRISAAIRSGGKSRLAAARRDSSCSKRALSDARMSMRVSLGERNALIPMGAPVAKQRQARSMQILLRRPEPVADPGFRQYVLRPLGIGLDLLPQLPHIDAQVLRVGEIVPQFAEQEFVRQHLAGVLHQYAQKVVLLGREFHVL